MEEVLLNIDIDRIFTFKDERGNEIQCINGNLYLKLVGKRVNPIGKIEYKKYVNRDYHQLIYEKKIIKEDGDKNTKDESFLIINNEVAKRVDGIVYYIGNKKYAIRREMATRHGEVEGLEEIGIEKYLYPPVEFWKSSSIK